MDAINNRIARQFKGHVILGLPPSPLSYLRRAILQHGVRPHVFLHRCPLWLRVLPLATVHVSAAQTHGDILLFELRDLARDQSERLFTLSAATPEAKDFISRHRDALEPLYTIEPDC